jgi:membrane-bound ClpP family serine protease
MTFFLIGMMGWNILMGLTIYKIMYGKRKLFSDRFGMVMAMSCSGILSLVLAMLLHFLFPIQLSFILLLSSIIGGSIGLLLGALVNFQSLLSGFTHGVVGSIMGTMLSAVIQDPSLCSLPPSYTMSLEQSIVTFSLFVTSLVVLTISLVYYSLRV